MMNIKNNNQGKKLKSKLLKKRNLKKDKNMTPGKLLQNKKQRKCFKSK